MAERHAGLGVAPTARVVGAAVHNRVGHAPQQIGVGGGSAQDPGNSAHWSFFGSCRGEIKRRDCGLRTDAVAD